MRFPSRLLAWLACLSAGLAAATPASARPIGCPAASSAHTGFIITLSNEEAFQVDRIVGDITYLRHLDNRLNTISSEELYRGLFTSSPMGRAAARSLLTMSIRPHFSRSRAPAYMPWAAR